MSKTMKTLNGYEVVDAQAREQLNNLVIPTKTSELTNDSNYATKSDIDNAIANIVNGEEVSY